MTSFQSSMGGAIRQKGLDDSSYFAQALQRLPAIMANSSVKAFTIIAVVNVALCVFIELGIYGYKNWLNKDNPEPETHKTPAYRYIQSALALGSVFGINCLLATIVKVQLNAVVFGSITACSLLVGVVRYLFSIQNPQDNKKIIELRDTKKLLDQKSLTLADAINQNNETVKKKMEAEKALKEVQGERDTLKGQLADEKAKAQANYELFEKERKITSEQELVISGLQKELARAKKKLASAEKEDEESKTAGVFKGVKGFFSSSPSKDTVPLTAKSQERPPVGQDETQSTPSKQRLPLGALQSSIGAGSILNASVPGLKQGLVSPPTSATEKHPLKTDESSLAGSKASVQKKEEKSPPASNAKPTSTTSDGLLSFLSSDSDGNNSSGGQNFYSIVHQ